MSAYIPINVFELEWDFIARETKSYLVSSPWLLIGGRMMITRSKGEGTRTTSRSQVAPTQTRTSELRNARANALRESRTSLSQPTNERASSSFLYQTTHRSLNADNLSLNNTLPTGPIPTPADVNNRPVNSWYSSDQRSSTRHSWHPCYHQCAPYG